MIGDLRTSPGNSGFVQTVAGLALLSFLLLSGLPVPSGLVAKTWEESLVTDFGFSSCRGQASDDFSTPNRPLGGAEPPTRRIPIPGRSSILISPNIGTSVRTIAASACCQHE